MTSSVPKPNPHIAALHAYKPGEQPQGGGWIKLNTNENPYAPSPKVAEAIRGLLSEEASVLRLYPSPDATPLREAAGRLHDFPAANIVAGNGSDDLLNLLIRAYAGPQRPVGMLEPSYSLYPVLAAAQGAPVVKVPVGLDGSFEVKAVIDSGASIFFLTSPNAPLGAALAMHRVRELAAVYQGLLVVDEAYAAFADEHAADLPKQFSHVVVTRTFSKGYALAGLRVGYALCSAEVAEVLHRVRDSYNVDRVAQVAAVAALEDTAWLKSTVAKICATRSRVTSVLRDYGWQVNPSSGNFILANPVKPQQSPSVVLAESAFQFLRERKILVRRFPQHPLTEKGLRITIGTDAEMDAFLAAAKAWTEG